MKCIGKVKEAHGLRGELYVLIFSGDTSWIDSLKDFQLLLPSEDVAREFQVKKVKSHKKGIIISASEIADRTAAEKLVGSQFLVSEDLFISKKGETIYLSEILNFSLVDEKNEKLGEVAGFSSNGVQDLLIIRNQEGEHLVPFVAPWIIDMDFNSKSLKMSLPEGLLGN